MTSLRILLERLRYRLARFLNSPWYRIAETRLDIIESQRVELALKDEIIAGKQQSIDQLIELLHSTEAARDLYKVELHDVEQEMVALKAERTEHYFESKEIR